MSPLRSPVQTPLNLFLPVRRGDEGALENLLMLTRLREPNPIDVALRRLGNVHFAQFVMIPIAPPAGVPDGPPPQSLAVLTPYDGEFDDYIVSFVEAIGDIFDAILMHVDGGEAIVPVRNHRDAFIEFIRMHDIQSGGGIFSAYPGRRTFDIRDALGMP